MPTPDDSRYAACRPRLTAAQGAARHPGAHSVRERVAPAKAAGKKQKKSRRQRDFSVQRMSHFGNEQPLGRSAEAGEPGTEWRVVLGRNSVQFE